MPWCSGKVTVPLGCSTALVMNRRPGHTPQLLPVDALAGMAIAPARMAIAISAVRPSAALANFILRNLVIFIGCPSLLRGQQYGRRPAAPAVSVTPIGVRSGPGLTSSRRMAVRSWEGPGANRSGFAGRWCEGRSGHQPAVIGPE